MYLKVNLHHQQDLTYNIRIIRLKGLQRNPKGVRIMIVWNKEKNARLIYLDKNGDETNKETADSFLMQEFDKNGKIIRENVGKLKRDEV